MLHEPGKKAQTKSYIWRYRTSREDGPPIVLYEYQPSRKSEHAAEFLEGFSGYLHADGYQGYHKLPESQPRAQRSGSRLERRSKGASAVFATGGNEVERTLRRRAAGHTHEENLMRL
ncbi:MAG: IS66 family transposase [Oscillospiraceae bacterium]|nr:IS66 family transposase [Oscillospiraceae bacterium]